MFGAYAHHTVFNIDVLLKNILIEVLLLAQIVSFGYNRPNANIYSTSK